jgi:hypothetical protein
MNSEHPPTGAPDALTHGGAGPIHADPHESAQPTSKIIATRVGTRLLALPHGTVFDLAGAQATAGQLIAAASVDDLHQVAEQWFEDTPRRYHGPVTDVAGVREHATAILQLRLHDIVESLTSPDVHHLTLGTGPDIDVHLTGGSHAGGDPASAYTAWALLLDELRLPTGWARQLATAAGILPGHHRHPEPDTASR